MSDITCLRTRRHRRAWDRAIRRFAKLAARHAGADLKASALLPLLVMVAAPGAFALPFGEQVQSGNVAISRPTPSSMTINQGTQKGIVEWTQFGIATGERVDIRQPSSQAVLLNRVMGNQVSNIAGQLNANGQVFLVNPAGVVFARGASVNVGSLVASTLGITNAEFLAGKYHFNQEGKPNASVTVEQGANLAAAAGGAVALLGAQVDNAGYVSATLGKIAIGAGSDITLDFAGDGLTMLKVNGDVAKALISNSGALQADDGQIVMSVHAADAAAASVLNQTGTIRARSVETRDGRIVLDGGANGVTNIGGTLDATAPGSGAGGRIDVTGFHVAVNDGARIDASGAQGGGRVRVGGGAAGNESDIVNSDMLWVSPSAQIHADALVAGDGGNIVMYGTEAARVYGALSARGGPQGGNGGLVETSSHTLVTDSSEGHADVRLDAPMGQGGTWLLDPASITIANDNVGGEVAAVPDGNNTHFTAAPENNSFVLASTINATLNGGGSVTITTNPDNKVPGNGDITMQPNVVLTKTALPASNSTLTLNAAGSIDLAGRIGGDLNGEARAAGRLNVVLDANQVNQANPLQGTNSITLNNATINTNGGFVTIGVPGGNTGFDGAAVGITNSTINTTVIGPSVGTGTGNITITGSGIPATVAVNIADSTLTTTAGNISVTGRAGDTTAPAGVSIGGASGLHTTSGNISIIGSAPDTQARLATRTNEYGVELLPVNLIPTGPMLSTVSGNITITGTGPKLEAPSGLALSGAGVLIRPNTDRPDDNPAVIRTGSGNISITGTGPSAVTATTVNGDGVLLAPTPLATGDDALIHSGSGSISIGGIGPSLQTLNANGTMSGYGVAVTAINTDGRPMSPAVASDSGSISMSGFGPNVAIVSNGALSGAGIHIEGSSQAVSAGASGSISLFGNGPTAVSLGGGSMTGNGVELVPTLVAGEGGIVNQPLLQSQAGSISVIGNGAIVQTVANTPGPTVTGNGVDFAPVTTSTTVLTPLPVIGTTSGNVSINGNGAVVQTSAGSAEGDGVNMLRTSIESGGSLGLSGTGASVKGGAGNVIGGGVSLQDTTLTAKGNVVIDGGVGSTQGTTQSSVLGEGLLFSNVNIEAGGTLDLIGRGGSATGAGSSVSSAGIELEYGTLTAGGAISINGTGPTASGANTFVDGDGVQLFGSSPPLMRITSTGGGFTIEGTGASATSGSFVFGNGADIQSINVNVAGPISITGTAGTATGGTGDVEGFGLAFFNSTLNAGGPVTLRGIGPVGSGAQLASVRGDGMSLVTTSITSAGGVALTGFGASANGATTAVGGAGVYGQNLTIVANGGDVSLSGTGAQGKVRYVVTPNSEDQQPDFDGVHLETSGVAANAGKLSIQGLAPDGIAAYGVFVSGLSTTPLLGLRANGAVTIFGLGVGSSGVALAGTAGNRGVVSSASGSVDIRGGTNGQLNELGARGAGVSIANTNVQANAGGPGVSLTASTLADGAAALVLNNAAVSAGDAGTIVVRASNSGNGGNVFDVTGAALSANAGTLVFAPARVGAGFSIAGQDAQPINVLGGVGGLTIGTSILSAAASNIATILIGSSTQTGKITVNQPTGFTQNLTLQNTGAGSAGIDLPSGLALPGKTLALASAGPVTDPGGIQTQTLLLAGGGDFDLTDVGNNVTTLALSGADNVNFSTPGSFTIGTASVSGLDGATGALTTLGGTQPNVTGNLVAISRNGAIALGTSAAPSRLSAGGSIDLVMQNAVFDNPPGGSLTAGNAWRVWAKTRDGEIRNGIDPGNALPNFYGCLYGGVCSWNGQPSQNVVVGNGNHFVYAFQPTITVTIGNQTRGEGTANGPFGFVTGPLLQGDSPGSAVVAGPLHTSATTSSPSGAYAIDGTFSSAIGYNLVVVPGTLTVTRVTQSGSSSNVPPDQLQGAVFNRTGLQPLFTAQEQSFVYESNTGAINICVGTNEPVLALQQSEGEADTLAAEWKRVRSRPNLNNCLVVNGQHGCGEF